VFAFDEFGPLGIRPTSGSCWAEQARPDPSLSLYRLLDPEVLQG
jgi:hypothetical protein